jgi:hypothetical protein
MSQDDLAAARDYWGQIYERLSSDPMATLVERDRVIADLASGRHETIADAYGLSPEFTEHLKREYVAKVMTAPVTSPGVDPHAEYILADLCKRIEAACDKVPQLAARNVVSGVEPKLGVFASRMGVIMTNASIVTIGSQVFRFCNVVSKALAQTVAIDPPGCDNLADVSPTRAKLRARPDILGYWFQIIASFAMLGTSVLVPLRLPPLEQAVLRDEILEALEIFVIAHEYAHHFCKHGRLQEASSDSGKDDRARAEEFEADTLAIAIGQMVAGHKPRENFLMLSGVGMVVVLHTLRMLDEARWLLSMEANGLRSYDSHPTAADRIDFIDKQDWLWPKLDSEFRHFRSAYGNMMEMVWAEIRPAFEALGRRESSAAHNSVRHQ